MASTQDDMPITPQAEQMRRLTLLWMKAQPVVAAFIASVVRDRHDVEDLTQEVAATVASSFERYDPAQPFTPWAIGVARNKVLHYLRSAKRDRHIFDEDLVLGLARAHETLASDYEDRRDALAYCLGRVPEHTRKILGLRYVREMGVAPIADQLGKTPGAVSNLLYRARIALADCIRLRLRAKGGRR
ncbi:MAG: sigma-70 family RNA polymerase sigma factor [Phycisphaerales bacterium JB063]